jgi:hypothetical protein
VSIRAEGLALSCSTLREQLDRLLDAPFTSFGALRPLDVVNVKALMTARERAEAGSLRLVLGESSSEIGGNLDSSR